ncbi:MAG: hypothetical protein RIB59_07825 [Rhodospirillales bacterium]
MALFRFSFYRLCAVLLIGVLAACAQTETPTVAANADANAAVEAGTEFPTPKRKPEEPQALPTLHDMIGLDREQVTALLGAPTFRRFDTPADLWQYGNDECILDLFLYRVKNGNVFKVTHADVRRVNGTALTKDACFKGLVTKHTGKKAG